MQTWQNSHFTEDEFLGCYSVGPQRNTSDHLPLIFGIGSRPQFFHSDIPCHRFQINLFITYFIFGGILMSLSLTSLIILLKRNLTWVKKNKKSDIRIFFLNGKRVELGWWLRVLLFVVRTAEEQGLFTPELHVNWKLLNWGWTRSCLVRNRIKNGDLDSIRWKRMTETQFFLHHGEIRAKRIFFF